MTRSENRASLLSPNGGMKVVMVHRTKFRVVMWFMLGIALMSAAELSTRFPTISTMKVAGGLSGLVFSSEEAVNAPSAVVGAEGGVITYGEGGDVAGEGDGRAANGVPRGGRGSRRSRGTMSHTDVRHSGEEDGGQEVRKRGQVVRQESELQLPSPVAHGCQESRTRNGSDEILGEGGDRTETLPAVMELHVRGNGSESDVSIAGQVEVGEGGEKARSAGAPAPILGDEWRKRERRAAHDGSTDDGGRGNSASVSLAAPAQRRDPKHPVQTSVIGRREGGVAAPTSAQGVPKSVNEHQPRPGVGVDDPEGGSRGYGGGGRVVNVSVSARTKQSAEELIHTPVATGTGAAHTPIGNGRDPGLPAVPGSDHQQQQEEEEQEGKKKVTKTKSFECTTSDEMRPYLERVAVDKLVIICTVNAGYRPLFLNWLVSVRNVGLADRVLVFADDVDSWRYVEEHWPGHVVILCDPDMEKSGQKVIHARNEAEPAFWFRMKDYGKLVGRRPLQILACLRHGYSVLYSDIDIVFMKNPLLYLLENVTTGDRRGGRGVVAEGEGRGGGMGLDGAGTWDGGVNMPYFNGRDEFPKRPAYLYVCSCLLYFRPTEVAKKILLRWIARFQESDGSVNQPPFNKALDDVRGETEMKFKILPGKLFPGGYTLRYPEDKAKWLALGGGDPVSYHVNFFYGIKQKITGFKNYGLWLLNDTADAKSTLTWPLLTRSE